MTHACPTGIPHTSHGRPMGVPCVGHPWTIARRKNINMKTRKRINLETVDKINGLIDGYSEFNSGAVEWHAKLDWVVACAEAYCQAVNDTEPDAYEAADRLGSYR